MLPYRALFLFIFTLLLALPLNLVYAQSVSEIKAGKGNFIIDSDSMEVRRGGKSIVFSGRVVTREEFTLCSDELKVTFNDKREILEIVATGSVRLLQDGKVATAEKAEYDKEARVIIFSGTPQISSCGDKVSGEKIRFDMDSGNTSVEGGEGVRVRAHMISDKNCTEDIIIEEDFCRGAR
jgi:lipopolysaccharide export system protein LptA